MVVLEAVGCGAVEALDITLTGDSIGHSICFNEVEINNRNTSL